MRDNKWLEDNLYELWETSFVDVPRKNRVLIKFGKKSYRQLGCIKWADKDTKGLRIVIKDNPIVEDDVEKISLIIITSYFKDVSIPDDVVRGTIAHEMCHYTHGFNSPLQQIFEHPHRGSVIRKEMTKRGLGALYKQSNKWLKDNWQEYIKSMKS